MFAFMNLLCTISSLTLLALSLPLKLRDVVAPPIMSPTADTVWHVGDKQLVTWSTTGLSSNVTNPVGMLVLGYLYNNSENLMLDSPLATNINYTVGQVLITVPDVETREDYIVVLFGDSGNASPEFTIINDSSSSSASAPSTSSVQSTTPSTSTSPTTQAPTETTPTSNSVNATPTTTSGITPAVGATTPTLSSGTTSVITSTATQTQTTLTGAAWRNHASGASIMLALVSLVYIF